MAVTMKWIGKGYYYNVYDLGNGRVKKIPRSQASQFFQLFQWYWLRPHLLVKEFFKFPFSKKKIEEQYEVSTKVISIAPQFFGNTVFTGYECEQDKGVRIADLVHTVSEETFLGYCKEYAHLVQELWKVGIGEKIYNFSLNAGVDQYGKVFLLDTNEFTFDKAEAESKISTGRPYRASSFRRLPKHLQLLVRPVFEKAFTVEKLEEVWNRSRKLT